MSTANPLELGVSLTEANIPVNPSFLTTVPAEVTIDSQDCEHIFDGVLTDAIADGSATIPWDATYAANDTGVPNGAYVVMVSTYDAAGNATQVDRTITATTTYHAR